jgi:hypothetical protein
MPTNEKNQKTNNILVFRVEGIEKHDWVWEETEK